MDFSGKTILYTGAAGGLGLATSVAFLKCGAKLVAIDNNPAKIAALRAAAADIRTGHLVIEAVDLSDLAFLSARLKDVMRREGGVDIVINNAAIYPSKPFEDYTIEEHQQVQRVNVDAGIVCVQAALPGMKAKGFGRIINVASITLHGGWALMSPYVASKAALVGLTRAWAREFGPYGVTVNAISPGAFPTDGEKIHPDPEGYAHFVLEHQALKRRGTPADIANVLMFLASDMSSFVTGQTINVDGGWVMH